MTSDVGITELRRHLGRYLQRVERSERLIVTNPNRPVAELRPLSSGGRLERLITDGRVSPATRRGLPEPLRLEGDRYALTRALEEVRGER